MDCNGKLLLHEACKQGLEVLVELLLEAGVDANRMENSDPNSQVRTITENFNQLEKLKLAVREWMGKFKVRV